MKWNLYLLKMKIKISIKNLYKKIYRMQCNNLKMNKQMMHRLVLKINNNLVSLKQIVEQKNWRLKNKKK